MFTSLLNPYTVWLFVAAAISSSSPLLPYDYYYHASWHTNTRTHTFKSFHIKRVHTATIRLRAKEPCKCSVLAELQHSVRTYNLKTLLNFVFHDHGTTRAMAVTTVSGSRNVQYHENVRKRPVLETLAWLYFLQTIPLFSAVVGRHFECRNCIPIWMSFSSHSYQNNKRSLHALGRFKINLKYLRLGFPFPSEIK